MGDKLLSSDDGRVLFFCPGCGYGHAIGIKAPAPVIWGWNGSATAPTFTPSVMVNRDDPKTRCHSFVRDGQIQFLADCWHTLKNQTVPLPDIEL